MPWFFIALASPLLWAITNHIDKHLVAKYSERIKFTSFVITSAVFFLTSALVIASIKPAVLHLEFRFIPLLLVSGASLSLYLFPYYQALREEEASIVTPLFQMVPLIGFILGFVFLHEHLTTRQIIAGLVIISGSIGITLDLNRRFYLKGKIFLLLLISCSTVSVGVLLYKLGAIRSDYWTAIFWQEIGIVLTACALLTVKNYRANFLQIWADRNYKFISIMGLNEVLSWGAGSLFSYAYLLAPIALVQLVGSIQPIFVLIMGIIGSVFIRNFTSEDLSRKFLAQKIVFIAIILVGSYLLFSSL